MASRRQTFPIEFRGGLISNLSPLQQGLNAVGSASILQNYEPSKEGGYKKILGYSKYIAGSVPGSGPMLGVKVVNAEKVIAVRKNGSNLSEYYINVGASWSTLGAGSSLGSKVRAVTYNFDGNDKTFFVDGANRPAIFNDTTDTLTYPAISATFLSDLVGADYVTEMSGTIFVGNDTNVIFSAPYDDEDYSAGAGGGIINIGQRITGLVTFRDQVIVFAENSIKRIAGTSISDFVMTSITDDMGCPFPDTIQEVGGDIMFMGPDGIRYLSASQRNNDFGLELASAPIEDDMKTLMRSTTSFASLILREKAQYRLFAYVEATAATASRGLLGVQFSNQDSSNMQWATLVGFKVYCADGRYASGQELTVFANEDGYVYKMEDGYSRDSAVIQSIYQTPFMPISDPMKRKTIYKMTLYTKTTGSLDLDLNFYYDLFRIANFNAINPATIHLTNIGESVFVYGGAGAIYGTATYGGVLDDVYDTLVVGAGKTFAFRIEDNSTNPAYALDAAIIEYAEHDRQ